MNMEEGHIDGDGKYMLVRSESPALASAANKLTTWVGLKMKEGWSPHGSMQMQYQGGKYYLVQPMIRD